MLLLIKILMYLRPEAYLDLTFDMSHSSSTEVVPVFGILPLAAAGDRKRKITLIDRSERRSFRSQIVDSDVQIVTIRQANSLLSIIPVFCPHVLR